MAKEQEHRYESLETKRTMTDEAAFRLHVPEGREGTSVRYTGGANTGGNWILALLKRQLTSGRQLLKIGVCQESAGTTY